MDERNADSYSRPLRVGGTCCSVKSARHGGPPPALFLVRPTQGAMQLQAHSPHPPLSRC
ncbi:hypothetical protein LguiA_011318 [Lonicera macranthoides]